MDQWNLKNVLILCKAFNSNRKRIIFVVLFEIPKWFASESSGSTKVNPFSLPDVYTTSQLRNYKNFEDIKQLLRETQLEDSRKKELSSALHVYFKDWLYGWTEHFIVKINEGQSKRIRCMAHKCFAICDEAIIRNLVSKRHPDLITEHNMLYETICKEKVLSSFLL